MKGKKHLDAMVDKVLAYRPDKALPDKSVTLEQVQRLAEKINSVDFERPQHITLLTLWLNTPACFADASVQRAAQNLAEFIVRN